MRVEIPIAPSTKRVYLDSLRDYPDPACRPHTDPTGTLAVLELDLRDVYRCAVTRVVNKQTVRTLFQLIDTPPPARFLPDLHARTIRVLFFELD